MNFPLDSSTQTNTALTTTGTSYEYVNTNDLTVYAIKSNVDSSLNNLTNTKQNTITVSTPLIKNDISNNISIDLSAYALKNNVDSSLNSLTTNKQNVFTCITPLIKNDISNNISIDLSAYPLKTYVDGSLNTINTTLSTKQNNLTFSTPMNKDVSNNVTIDLSAYPLKTYVDGSLNTINTTLSTKQNNLTFSTPMNKDVSNNVTIDLSAYPLKTYVDGSLNTINTTLSTKQNNLTFSTPMNKDVSNNVTIDLSAYPLKTYVDGSLNTINTTLSTKQNNLTFSTPMNKDVSNNVTIDLSAYALNNSLNASNITSGTLSISRGGIGTTTLSANQILIGNAATSILQSANLTWNNTSNTLSATNFVGAGAGLSALNASNATTGTLSISRGGIGTTTLSANQILIGNAATSILQSANLTWNNTSNTLSATNFVGAGSGITNLNYNNISTNKPTFTTPLKQDASNNVTIDLSAYPLKTYVDGSLNTINTTLSTKQNNLTFSNPLLNTSNTITFKINTTHFNIDSSGNLSLVTTSYLPLSGGSLTGDLTINKSNPNIQLTGTTGYNIAVPSSNGFFATDASANDMVIRSINKLLLLSGGGTSAITINTSNNVGIGTTNPGTNKLNVNGNTLINGVLSLKTNLWHLGNDNIYRIYYGDNSTTYLCSGGVDTDTGFSVLGSSAVSYVANLTVKNNGETYIRGNVGLGNPTPLGTLSIGRPDSSSDGTLVISKNSGGNRNFKIGYDGAYNMCFGDFGNATSGNTWRSTDFNIRYFDGNVGIGIAGSSSYKLYVNGSTYINGATTINGALNLDGNKLNFLSSLDKFKINLWGTNLYGFGIDSGTLQYTSDGVHRFYTGNTNTATIDSSGNFSINGALTVPQLTRSRNFQNYGEIVNYTVNYNGGSNSGFFWTTNGYWENSQASYLTLCIYPTGISNVVWYGRAFLARTGGFYNVICDYRNPDGGFNTIIVQDFWGPNGANALKIDLYLNFVYGSSFVVKAMG